jgi:diguanylate cyclase (GGDEF)-like protein/PAS domain S-box-containing protein
MNDIITSAMPVELSRLSDLKSAALEAAASAIVITDREGTVLWVNTAFEHLTGYSHEEVIGRSTRLLKSGLQPKSFYKDLWDTILAGHQWRGELTNRRKDGTIYAEEMTISPVRNPGGESTHFVAVKQDITERRSIEMALRESEERLRTVLDSTAEAIYSINLSGNCTLCNSACARMLGYNSPADLLGKNMHALMHHTRPDGTPYPAKECRIYQAFLQGEGTHVDDEIMWRKDGTSFPAEYWSYPMRHGENIVGSVATFLDITERKQAQQKLCASEEQFRQLVDNIHEVFFVVTPDPIRMVYLSPAYEEIWGRSRQEAYDRPEAWIESVHPEDRERVGAFFFTVYAKGVQGTIKYRVVRPDDSIRWIEAQSFPVRDSTGKLIRVVGIAEDFTARKERVNALKETHEKLTVALEELKEQTQGAAKLAELVDILQSCQDAEEAFKITASVLQGMLRSTAGALYITSPSRDVVEMVASWGDIQGTEKVFRPDDCWGLRRGRVHRVKNSESPLRCAHAGASLADSFICVPLAAQGETLGVLCVENLPEPAGSPTIPRPNQEDVLERQATAIAERISLALANLRLREVLRSQSIRDPLTGLFNRRFMEESLERELRRALRGKQQVALVMLDIDHFKQFNDTFGHQAGDALLRALGNLLKESTRGQDVACRYGGEEFVFVLSGASLDSAWKRAELLREEIKHLSVRHGGQLLGAVTLSVGIAAFPDNGDSADQLLKAADDALYRAKESGRDRIVSA